MIPKAPKQDLGAGGAKVISLAKDSKIRLNPRNGFDWENGKRQQPPHSLQPDLILENNGMLAVHLPDLARQGLIKYRAVLKGEA